MIHEIRALREKYKRIGENSEYVNINQVENDLYHLEQNVRLKRIPKDKR